MSKIFFVSVMCAISAQCWGYERIVSIAPSNTAILLQLGMQEKIVGVSNQCTISDGTHVERVGEFEAVNKERLFALQPDLVLTTDGIQEKIARELLSLGLNVKIISPKNITDVYTSIQQIGEWTGTQEKAKALISSMKNTIETVDKKVKNISQEKKPRIFIEMWNNPLSTAGSKSFIHEMVLRAGGENIAQDIREAYPRINPEWVVQQNPDIIIIGYQFEGYRGNWKEDVRKRPGWFFVTAVQKNEIIDTIPPEYFLQPGPDIAQGIKLFNDIIMRVVSQP